MAAQKPPHVGVRELRVNLTRYLKAVRARETVLITSRGAVIAELRAPPAALLPPRKPGALKGRIHVSEDFDTLPADILEAMEVWEH